MLLLCSTAMQIGWCTSQEIFEEVVDTSVQELSIEETPSNDSLSSAISKMIFTLVALLVLFGVSYWLLKRMGRSRIKNMNQSKAIKVRERRPISPKTTLYLVELAGKEVLVAESQLDVRTLATYEWPNEEPKPLNTQA